MRRSKRVTLDNYTPSVDLSKAETISLKDLSWFSLKIRSLLRSGLIGLLERCGYHPTDSNKLDYIRLTISSVAPKLKNTTTFKKQFKPYLNGVLKTFKYNLTHKVIFKWLEQRFRNEVLTEDDWDQVEEEVLAALISLGKNKRLNQT